jgi:hypothetical protein
VIADLSPVAIASASALLRHHRVLSPPALPPIAQHTPSAARDKRGIELNNAPTPPNKARVAPDTARVAGVRLRSAAARKHPAGGRNTRRTAPSLSSRGRSPIATVPARFEIGRAPPGLGRAHAPAVPLTMAASREDSADVSVAFWADTLRFASDPTVIACGRFRIPGVRLQFSAGTFPF